MDVVEYSFGEPSLKLPLIIIIILYSIFDQSNYLYKSVSALKMMASWKAVILVQLSLLLKIWAIKTKPY